MHICGELQPLLYVFIEFLVVGISFWKLSIIPKGYVMDSERKTQIENYLNIQHMTNWFKIHCGSVKNGSDVSTMTVLMAVFNYDVERSMFPDNSWQKLQTIILVDDDASLFRILNDRFDHISECLKISVGIFVGDIEKGIDVLMIQMKDTRLEVLIAKLKQKLLQNDVSVIAVIQQKHMDKMSQSVWNDVGNKRLLLTYSS